MLKNNVPFQEKINFTPDKLPEYFHPGKNILAENCARVTIFSLKNPTPLGGYIDPQEMQKVCINRYPVRKSREASQKIRLSSTTQWARAAPFLTSQWSVLPFYFDRLWRVKSGLFSHKLAISQDDRAPGKPRENAQR